MNRRTILWLFLAVAVSLLLNAVLGRYLSAKLSTLPLLNRWKIVSPQAPIVINQREEVRVLEGTDTLEAVSASRGRVAAVIAVRAGQQTVSAALPVATEGVFLTSRSAVPEGSEVTLSLGDGRSGKVTAVSLDPGSDLIFLKTSLGGSVAAFANSEEVRPGERLFFLAPGGLKHSAKFLATYASQAQADVAGQAFSSDRPSRSFAVQSIGPLVTGQALLNLKGEVTGLWTGSQLVSSDVLRQAVARYLKGGGTINRPTFGFTYSYPLSPSRELVAEVRSVERGSRAALGGLAVGDEIISVAGREITESQPLEELLEGYQPGEALELAVRRDGKRLTLTVTAGPLK